MNSSFTLRHKKIWVAGHRGMVGSALMRRLERKDCTLLTNNLDLRNQPAVNDWMADHKPDVLFLAAAKVGGIGANAAYPADFLYDNLMIESNIIHTAHKTGVEKLLFLGSSCIYPKHAPQPTPEDALLTGPLEPTNESYAIAKIAGIKLCQAYRRQHSCNFVSAMPCNLYGPGDTYDQNDSHVIPALIMKMHKAKAEGRQSVKIWGSGNALREFLYVDDLADALLCLMENYDEEQHINIGSGEEITIAALAEQIKQTIGFDGALEFDTKKPDGTPRKIMDSCKIKTMGWQPKTTLTEGLKKAYADYLQNHTMSYAA